MIGLDEARRLDREYMEWLIARQKPSNARGLLGQVLKNKKLLAGGAAVLAFGFLFTGRKNTYNEIPGMHPGSEGMGAESIRAHSAFGSGLVSPFWGAYKQKAAEEGWGYYEGYRSPERMTAEEKIDVFTLKRRNLLEGIHPGSEGMGAQSIREHSEFRAKWDPVRKIAREIFKDQADDVAFKQLTQSKPFREAIATGLKGKGKKIGAGAQAEVWAYTAQMQVGKEMRGFEFAVKRGLAPGAGTTASQAIRNQESLIAGLKAEAGALEALGAGRAPSFYGHAKEFGLPEEAILMEKFQLGTPLTTYKKKMVGGKEIETLVREDPLNIKEVKELESFMKSAHKQGITHTDMHSENVVRAISPATGKQEVAVLDWGMANRFQEVKGIGGHQEIVTITEGGKLLQSELQKAAGRPVGMHEFAEAADILRVRAHKVGTKAPRASRLAINAPYSYNETVNRITSLEKQLAALKANSPGALADIADLERRLAPAPLALAKKRDLISEVADNVANYLSGSSPRATVPLTAPILSAAKGSLETGTAVINKARQRALKSESMMHADTMLAEYSAKTTLVKQPATAITRRKTPREAIRRNKRFTEISERSVGVGLRASASATKGHSNFSSTRSTIVR